MSYQFENLTPLDFEHLCKDLLEEKLHCNLEIFSSGADGGIDLRGAFKNNTTIIQCKLYSGNYSQLKNSLKTEIVKINNIKPDRYIIITTAKLTPKNKEEIKTNFKPYIKNTFDIIGKEEIISMLGNHPTIENKHFKLWISSTNILKHFLEQVINKDIMQRSRLEIEHAQKMSKFYVINKSFELALKKLNENDLVIISGIPGIGKTMLAQMLFLYCLKDYELVTIHSNITDCLKMEKRDKKQIFYFDDFLGQTNLIEKGNVENDKDIMSIINQFKSPTNKFIFTTREYILQEALDINETLARNENKLKILKYILNPEDYTKKNKLMILYNHLYHNKVPVEYIKDLVKNKNYKAIINHKNYNPRLIENFTISYNIEANKGKLSYDKYCLSILNSPNELWSSPFKRLTEYSKTIILTLWLFRGYFFPIYLDNVKKVFMLLLRSRAQTGNFKISSESWYTAQKETEGTFISINKKHNVNTIKFFNPSVIDFLNHFVKNNDIEIDNFLKMHMNEHHFQQLSYYINANHKVTLNIVIPEIINQYFLSLREYTYQSLSIAFFNVFEYCNKENQHLIETFYLSYRKTHPDNSDYIMDFYNKAEHKKEFTAQFLKKLLQVVYDDILEQETNEILRYKDLYTIHQVLNIDSDIESHITKALEYAIEDISEEEIDNKRQFLENISELNTFFHHAIKIPNYDDIQDDVDQYPDDDIETENDVPDFENDNYDNIDENIIESLLEPDYNVQ